MSIPSAKANKPPTDMATKVGGRTFQPSLPVVDGEPPNATEQGFQSTLDAYIQNNIPLESVQGIQTRERVLSQLGGLCREWIRSVCASKGFAPDVVDGAGGQLYTSGSYRLGVHEPGADIDCILVAPAMCHRHDFFGTTAATTEEPQKRDPNSLAERIRRHGDVTNFVPVEGAAVPILTFDWLGINIDLLFARLNINSIPPGFDIDNDAVLDGADSATEKSLNGPRVTNLIAAFVSGTPERYQAFLTVVRCVRKWAKARGLYSNKMGYWGGVNCNLAVALTVQLYPNACPATLLRRFFLVFKTWRWPQPVLLTAPHDAGFGLPVWSPLQAVRQVAPMITPAYPAMNSTLAVSRQTLQIMTEEFNRGHEIVDSLWKEYQADKNSLTLSWERLFEPSDFFISYSRYLSLCIVGPTQEDTQAWAGFVESRLRKLVSDGLGRSLPLKKIQLWPKKFQSCIADKNALLTAAQRQNCLTYFVGFQLDPFRMRGSELNVEIPLYNFREYELGRFQPLVPGMDILVKSFHVKELPLTCFADYKLAGEVTEDDDDEANKNAVLSAKKHVAMKKRRQRKNADPARLERKRRERLQELKDQMEEKLKRQKDRKRKREEEAAEAAKEESGVKEETTETKVEAQADEAPSNSTVTAKVEEEEEEANLLENALDAMQGTAAADKTRQEAEADRQKLLAGELYAEDDDGGDASSDDEAGYVGARLTSYTVAKKKTSQQQQHTDMRSLPPTERESELLKALGYAVVSDDECKVLCSNMPHPWKSVGAGKAEAPLTKSARIVFQRAFDVVELDAQGHVIDKGDDDFMPSKEWAGRRAGFEFKMGERGLGYYRTGKKVVVPSNTAY